MPYVHQADNTKPAYAWAAYSEQMNRMTRLKTVTVVCHGAHFVHAPKEHLLFLASGRRQPDGLGRTIPFHRAHESKTQCYRLARIGLSPTSPQRKQPSLWGLL